MSNIKKYTLFIVGSMIGTLAIIRKRFYSLIKKAKHQKRTEIKTEGEEYEKK